MDAAKTPDVPRFERVMNLIGFRFVNTGGCLYCDAKFICRRVGRFLESYCPEVCLYHNHTFDGCFKFK